ncbi:MAG: hypothetical protein ACK4PR_04425 [Gammaproteobacteria bacterium]
MHNNIDPTKINQNGWRQGACLLITSSSELYKKFNLQSEELYVALSQDCDILNSCLQREPVIELIHAQPVMKLNSLYSSGKHPRMLHIPSKFNGKDIFLEFLPHKRILVPRDYLITHVATSHKIEQTSLRVLTRWITKRYIRAAFPDAFNQRVNTIRKKISSILESEPDLILKVLISLSPDDEISGENSYNIIIKMLVDPESYYNTDIFNKISRIFDNFINEIGKCSGIEIDIKSQIRSTDTFTIREYQDMKEWDFDYLSFLNDEENNILDVPE